MHGMEKLKILADFHTKLVELAHNDLLIDFHQTITYNLARYQYRYPYRTDTFRYSQEHHRKIIEGIQTGAFEQAKSTLENHHRMFVEMLAKNMREENLSPSCLHEIHRKKATNLDDRLLQKKGIAGAKL